MKALRTGSSAPRQESKRLRWAPAYAAALALSLFGVGWLWHSRPEADDQAKALTAATTALQVGSEMPPTLTMAAVAPLTGELDRCYQDLDRLGQFLLASLP